MFIENLENINENTYNIKLIKAGQTIKIKEFSTLQTRKKTASDIKKYDVVTEEGQTDIYNTTTGQIFTIEEWEIMFNERIITKQQYFFTKEKFLYHSMTFFQKKIRNKIISLKRSKETIVNLINANAHLSKERTKFLTLTFKENITDVKEANVLFRKFIRRFNIYLKKGGMLENVKYISVLENQERGAIHYHIILFNVPYIPFEDYLTIWSYGGAYIESLMKNDKIVEIDCSNGDFKVNGEKIENIGAYITKTIDYITKSFKDLESNLDLLTEKTDKEINVIFTENAKIFQTSKNLEKAKEVYFTVNENFKKFYKYLELFFNGELRYSEFENELFLLETYEINYNDQLEELDNFLNILEVLG